MKNVYLWILSISILVVLGMALFLWMRTTSPAIHAGSPHFTYPRTWHLIASGSAVAVSPATLTTIDDIPPAGIVHFDTLVLSDMFRTAIYRDRPYTRVDDLIDALREDEALARKNGDLPTAPGPGQYTYLGMPSLSLPTGYEELSSLMTEQPNSHLYWRVRGDTLDTLYIAYPLDPQAHIEFDQALTRIVDSLAWPETD